MQEEKHVMMDKRKLLVRLIHVARRDIGMDEETYRSVLLSITGKASASSLGILQLEQVLAHMKKCGFKVRTNRQLRPLAGDAQSKKIRALWLDLHQAGAVRNASEEALAAFVKRMTGIDALQWLDSGQASQVIEELKKWKNRVSRMPT